MTQDRMEVYHAAWNKLEGTLPHMPTDQLYLLGLTPASHGPQLQGSIPSSLARAKLLGALRAGSEGWTKVENLRCANTQPFLCSK